MHTPPKKIDTLRQLIAAGDWRGAFALAAKFPRLGAERNAILDAHEAFTRPAFLLQLRKDPAAIIEAGKATLLEKYVRA
jgi:hypothetical protein